MSKFSTQKPIFIVGDSKMLRSFFIKWIVSRHPGDFVVENCSVAIIVATNSRSVASKVAMTIRDMNWHEHSSVLSALRYSQLGHLWIKLALSKNRKATALATMNHCCRKHDKCERTVYPVEAEINEQYPDQMRSAILSHYYILSRKSYKSMR